MKMVKGLLQIGDGLSSVVHKRDQAVGVVQKRNHSGIPHGMGCPKCSLFVSVKEENLRFQPEAGFVPLFVKMYYV